MTPDRFWAMTFSEVDIYCRGYEIRMARLKEVPRLIAALIYNSNRKKDSPALDVEKIFPLYTDKAARIVELMTKEELEELKEYRKKIVWNQNSKLG